MRSSPANICTWNCSSLTCGSPRPTETRKIDVGVNDNVQLTATAESPPSRQSRLQMDGNDDNVPVFMSLLSDALQVNELK